MHFFKEMRSYFMMFFLSGLPAVSVYYLLVFLNFSPMLSLVLGVVAALPFTNWLVKKHRETHRRELAKTRRTH